MQKYGPKEGLKKYKAAQKQAFAEAQKKADEPPWYISNPEIVHAVEHVQVELNSVKDLMITCRFVCLLAVECRYYVVCCVPTYHVCVCVHWVSSPEKEASGTEFVRVLLLIKKQYDTDAGDTDPSHIKVHVAI